MAQSNITNEFFITYIDDFYNYKDLLETSCKRWNTVAKNQLKRKVNKLEKVWGDEKKRTKNFEVSFQNGSKAYFLYIPKNIDVFLLHSALRLYFSEEIKEHETISFNLYNVSESHQKILVNALSSLIFLSQWKPPKYGKKSNEKIKIRKKNFGFYSSLSNKKVNELIDNARAISEGTNLVRTLANTPTNLMTSKHLVQAGKDVYRGLKRGVKLEFINENKLKQMKAGCFLSVIQGTNGSNGGIVHLSYKTRCKNPQNIALIGKGVTFDTGGYDVKTEGMIGMHRDMTGAAITLATFQALVKRNVKANIDLYMAVAENLISETAYKSNDVVIAMDGTAVEVLNTDAEGRMVLADTILYANQKNPDIIIDFATLTGGAVYSIDTRYACVFSNNYDLALKSVEIGNKCGERVWNFPTSDDFCDILDSEVADICQSPDEENADHIYAACFLKYFAGKTNWVHLDLSAEKNFDGLGLVSTDITGFGVRWAFEFVQSLIGDANNE